MADEKATPKKVIIKLRDQSSIFHDQEQRVTLSGKEVLEVVETGRIVRALKGGALEKATKDELSEWNKEKAKKPAPPAADNAVVDSPVPVKTEEKDEDLDEDGEKKVPAGGKGHKEKGK